MVKNALIRILLYCLSVLTKHTAFLSLAQGFFSLPALHKTHQVSSHLFKLLLQGSYNWQTIPYHFKRIWPFWVYRQFSPKSPQFSSSSLPFSAINSTQRNWTTLSYPGSKNIVFVDPHGLITPFENGWSLDIWLAKGQTIISPAKLKHVQQHLHDTANCIESKFHLETINVSSEVFYQPHSGTAPTLFNQVTLKNTSDQLMMFSFYFAIRPYNSEGISPISKIHYLTTQGFVVDNKLALVLDEKPDNIVCSSFFENDISEQNHAWEMILQTTCKHHLASAYAEYRLTLKPGEEKKLCIKIPMQQSAHLLGTFQKSLPLIRKEKLQSKISELHNQSFDNAKPHCQQQWAVWKIW